MCRPGDAMCGVNKAETRGYGCSRKVMRGGGGGGDRVGKRRVSKGETDSRDKYQYRRGRRHRNAPLRRTRGADGVPTAGRGYQRGVDGKATLTRWTPCERMGRVGSDVYDANDETGDNPDRRGQEGATVMKRKKEPRRWCHVR